jgi:hypothetical protein
VNAARGQGWPDSREFWRDRREIVTSGAGKAEAAPAACRPALALQPNSQAALHAAEQLNK